MEECHGSTGAAHPSNPANTHPCVLVELSPNIVNIHQVGEVYVEVVYAWQGHQFHTVLSHVKVNRLGTGLRKRERTSQTTLHLRTNTGYAFSANVYTRDYWILISDINVNS